MYYIGVKIIDVLKEEERDGRPGYVVRYEDGYESWSPKDVLDKAYLPMGEGNGKANTVTQEMVDLLISTGRVHTRTEGDKTTLVGLELSTGFELWESSSCVDPKNYSQELGAKICVEKIMDKVWHLLGFVVQWGKYGLKAGK